MVAYVYGHQIHTSRSLNLQNVKLFYHFSFPAVIALRINVAVDLSFFDADLNFPISATR